MTTIVHRTPGLLDTRSFTISGMSAKPGSKAPIGQFGTGLKYSIAGLLRSGAAVSIWIGREHWQFELEETEFRGQAFSQIIAWRRSWGGLRRKKVLLPFTTQLGPHWTWWMWMRELHSNTLDEGGYTSATTDTWEELGLPVYEYEHDEVGTCHVTPRDDQTLIVVDHEDYAAAWRDRADVFLPGATGPAGAAGRILEAIPSAPHGRLYYRGLRVLDLRLPSVTCTWNILETTPLTEDRTMHEFYARAAIARWLVRDCEEEDLIACVLSADEHHWENGMEFPHHLRPSDAFERAARAVRRPSPRLGSYLGVWAPATPPDTRPFFERRGRRWQVAEEQVLDERGRLVLEKPEALPDEDWRELAGTLIAAVAPRPEGECPTCHQPLPKGPPPRPAVVGDLYAGLRHDWVTHWPEGDDFDGRKDERCSMCGVRYDENAETDQVYEDCPGPEWMRGDLDPGAAHEPELVDEEDCPGHVASEHDSKICGRCGTHIDSLRPPEEEDDDIVF